MQLARAGSSGLASSTVALKCAFGSSGLERMGLESGGLEMINCIWRRLEWIGLESKKLEASKSIWLERARADWPRALWLWSVTVHLARAGSSERPRDLSSLGPNGPIRSSPLEPNGLWKNGFWNWQVRKTGGYCGPGGAKYQRLYLYLIIFNYIIILMGSKRPWPRGSADIFSFKADASAADLRRGFEWKSMKIPQKSMTINKNNWKSMHIHENQ